MKRQMILLVALAAIASLAVFWTLLWQPQRAELAELEESIAAEETTQAELQAELSRLRSVREEAPAVVAELAAAEAVLPFESALPSALRQLQTAADEAQLTLVAVAPARPAQIEGAAPGVASIALNVQLRGSYFQIVDFLRRTEDPSISPRAMLWNTVEATKDEYPALDVALTGAIFAQLPAAPPPVEETPTDDAEVAEGEGVENDETEGVDDDATADETTEVTP